MIKFKKYTTLLIIFSFVIGVISAEKPNSANGLPGLSKTTVSATGNFDGNRIRDDLENNGMVVSHRISGHSGMEWPKDNNTYTVFASGVWVAGMVGTDIRTATAEYAPEMVAGPYGGNQNATEHKLYKVSKSDLADPLANPDFKNWPVDLGAPWVDVDGNGAYNPLPLGTDTPDFIGDQVIWYVANDGDPVGHSTFGTMPLGIESQTTIFGFDRPDVFGDMMFIKQLIINKGDDTVTDTYLGLWSDPDLGDAGDDFVSCDTTLGLGICYNDGVDHDYEGFSGGTPAVGYDFFQGPMVPSVGDTAFMYGKSHPDMKNLKMTSFSKYINTTIPEWSDPNDAVEVYNLMKGLKKDGTDAINGETGAVTKFFYPDDPSLNTGTGDGVWADADDHVSGDRRFLMNTGPFTMAPGDSQEVVFGIMMAAAGGPFDSFHYLKEVDALAQLAYDIQFALPESPPQPEVAVTSLPEEIILTWDDAAEYYTAVDVIDKLPVPVSFDTTWVTDIEDIITTTGYDTVIVGTDTTITAILDTAYNYIQVVDAIDTTYEGENTQFTFEGYNVYQYETLSGTGDSKLIATYDLVNGITEIFDDVFDPNFGETINRRVQFGSDSGVKRYIQITTDALDNNSPLKMNREYYFSVVAYGYNPYGIPRTLESALQIQAIRPATPNLWGETDSTAVFGDQVDMVHSEGLSDGFITVDIIDPTALTGDDYKVGFYTQHYYLDVDGLWKYTDYPDSVGRRASKTLDCSGSVITAAAIVSPTVGTVDLTFTLSMDCGNNWVDGLELDLPDDLTINSWDAIGDCSYGAGAGQNCVNAEGTLDGATNTITWGDAARSTFGMIEGGMTFVVNVAPPAAYPLSFDYEVWDDAYDGTTVDAVGTALATELGYDFKSIMYWEVTNLTTVEVVIPEQTTQSGVAGDMIIDGVFYASNSAKGNDADPIVEGFQVHMTGAPNDLKTVGVVANSTGTLASPVDGLAYWYYPSYLVADGDYTDQQPTTGATWLLNVGPQYGVDEDAFMNSVFAYTGGYGHSPSGIGVLVPDDFEVRFTGLGKAVDYWGAENTVDVPFEWWNIGDVNDPADDYQLIPYFLDEDGNGIWNLQIGADYTDPTDADHGTSGGANDPWTDRVYVLSPTDDTPGSVGYDAFFAASTPGSLPAWYAGPGDNDAGGPLDAWQTFGRTTFMNWNGGDVTTATSPADYNAESPEIGTVFRIATTKPNNLVDAFTFNTDMQQGKAVVYSPDAVKAWPNPYFGYNPEERNPIDNQVHFTHLPESGNCTIRIFDLSGVNVRNIEHNNAETQVAVWDLKNNFELPVASGMYLAHIETDKGDKVLKLAVVMPEQRIDVY